MVRSLTATRTGTTIAENRQLWWGVRVSTSSQTSTRKTRSEWIDLIKATSVILVVFFHSVQALSFVAGGSFSFLPGTGTANVYAAGASSPYKSSTANGGSTSSSGLRVNFNGNMLRVNNGSVGGAYAYAK